VEFWRQPERSGWLMKQGEFVKTWRRRWFILKDGKIFWFKTEHLLFLLIVSLVLLLTTARADHGQPQPEKAKIQFTAFPNPTQGIIKIEYSTLRAGEAKLLLLDVIGREVDRQESQIQAGKHVWEFDLSGRTPGLYFIQLEHADGRASKRVVLK
jgi:hypothetical protein